MHISNFTHPQTYINNISFSAKPKLSSKNPCVKDAITLSTKNYEIISKNEPLLKGYKPKPLSGFDKLSPEKLALVHMSEYFPKGGQITSVKNATLNSQNKAKYRSTVHFALNHVVREHSLGNNWSSMKYAIILPLNGVMKNTQEQTIIGGELIDFFIMGNVKLPEGSVIVRQNPLLPKDKYKVIDASTIEGFENTKGIKIIEGSNPSMKELASDVIGKMGYSNIEKMINRGQGYSDEYLELISSPEKMQKMASENPKKYMEIMTSTDLEKITDFNKKTKKHWAQFSQKYNFTPCMHTYSPWGRSEALIAAIKLISLSNNSWVVKFEQADSDTDSDEEDFSSFILKDYISQCYKEEIDYRKEFLKIIDEIKKDTPKDKSLSYDIDTLKSIMQEAQTPAEALSEIEEQLNLLPMVSFEETKDVQIPSEEEIANLIDTLLAITDTQKEAMDASNKSWN